MVGNDIIDLHFLDSPPYQHIRHLKQVCSEDEVRAVRNSGSPSITLAALWACKEAAYKVFSREFNCHFVPKRFAVCFEGKLSLASRETATVTYDEVPVGLELLMTNQWVHAVAISPSAQFARYAVGEIEQRYPENLRAQTESHAVRFLAAECVSRFCEEDLLLDFNGKVPVLMRKMGERAEIDISFSHHGGFAAVAMAWPKSRGLQFGATSRFFGNALPEEDKCSTCTA